MYVLPCRHLGARFHVLLLMLLRPQNASKNDDYASISDADAVLLVAGDPAAEDEAMRKGTCFQVSLAATAHCHTMC